VSDYIAAAARRVMAALNKTTLDRDTDLHFDVWTLAQEWLAPSAMVPAPEELAAGVYRWTGPAGWKVTLNRHGDVYVSDARIPADERATLVDIIRAAHTLGRHLPVPDLDQPEAS
jgi:hypothetical protein